MSRRGDLQREQRYPEKGSVSPESTPGFEPSPDAGTVADLSRLLNAKPEASDPWNFRLPGHRSLQRDEPIVVDGRLLYQQAPPVHAKRAPQGRGRTPKTIRVVELGQDVYDLLRATGATAVQRQVLQLQAEGYSYAEIAGQLGISETTVRERLRRARQRLARARVA